MTWGRPRPAALFLPQDLMRASVPARSSRRRFPIDPNRRYRPRRSRGQRRSWPGPSARSSWPAAAPSGRERPRRSKPSPGSLAAPVVTTLNGKGLLDERSPLSLGHARSSRGRHALPHADVMLAVGCRFTEVMTDWRRMPVPKTLIQIDLDPEQIGMNHPVVVGIVADARAAVGAPGRGSRAGTRDGTAGASCGTKHAPPVPPSRSG